MARDGIWKLLMLTCEWVCLGGYAFWLHWALAALCSMDTGDYETNRKWKSFKIQKNDCTICNKKSKRVTSLVSISRCDKLEKGAKDKNDLTRHYPSPDSRAINLHSELGRSRNDYWFCHHPRRRPDITKQPDILWKGARDANFCRSKLPTFFRSSKFVEFFFDCQKQKLNSNCVFGCKRCVDPRDWSHERAKRRYATESWPNINKDLFPTKLLSLSRHPDEKPPQPRIHGRFA